jgi:hypothetical protein
MVICTNCGFDAGDRRSYEVLQQLYFADAYSYALQIGRLVRERKVEPMPHGSEYAYAYEQANFSASCFDIEALMVEVISLTLDAGRGSLQFIEYHHGQIRKILQRNDLRKMLDTLPPDEREEFEHALKVLHIPGLAI